MTEHSAERQKPETAFQVFQRTALTTYVEFLRRTEPNVIAQRHSTAEFSSAFSDKLDTAKIWLPYLGGGVFDAYLTHREPPRLRATGDAYALEVLTVQLTAGVRFDNGLMQAISAASLAASTRLGRQMNYQDLVALHTLGKNFAPGVRFEALNLIAGLLNNRRSAAPLELGRLVASLSSAAAKAGNEYDFFVRFNKDLHGSDFAALRV